MKIDYPSKEEKKSSINLIIGQALPDQAPNRFISTIKPLFKMDLRFLFWDSYHFLFVGAIVILTMILAVIMGPPESYFSSVFALAPVSYFVCNFLMGVSQSGNPLYEVEKASSISGHQLNAYRMLVFSSVGMATALVLSLSQWQSQGWQGAIASLFLMILSLFSSAFFTLLISKKSPRLKNQMIYLALWLLANALLIRVYGPVWEAFLRQIPPIASGILAFVFISLYVKELSQLLRQGVKYYAYH